jgi:hypothetical protein
VNSRDRAALLSYYAEAVTFNGKVLDSTGVVNAVMDNLLKKGIERVQISNMTVDAPTPGVRRVEFRKKLFMKGATQENTSLLLLERDGSSWKITAESDKPLQMELQQDNPRSISEKEISTCDQAATAIFLSSADVKQMLADPKVQYKMEYAPGAAGNPNNRYWFWIYMPHAQGTETYARYQVDPSSGILYEYDQVADALKKAQSDSRLSKYLKSCK